MHQRRFLIELAASMIAYMFVLMASIFFLSTWDMGSIGKTIIALMPMVPGGIIALAVMRQLRSSDELQHRIQLEALSLAFGGTALVTFSYGFLENVGYPKLSMFFVWPLMAAFWIVGRLVSGRRFR